MKVVFCMGGLSKGGAERVVCNLSNYLQECGNQVYLILTKIDKIEYVLNNNIKIISLEDKLNNKKFRNLKLLDVLKKELIDINPDICLAFLQEPTARVLILKVFNKFIRKIPLIISVRIDPKKAFNTLKRRLSLHLYNMADGFVFQTKEAQSFFNKKIQNKSKVIANSLDINFFGDLYTGKRKNIVVSVGRLTEQKEYPTLINSFEIFLYNHDNYKLFIYGDGPLDSYLQDIIDNKGLSDKIFLKGNVSDIKKEIYDARMFCIVSSYEGVSNALMESMALGIPCISTDSSGGGAKSLIENSKNGLLVDVGDEQMISLNMSKIADDEDFANKLSYNSWYSMKKYKPDIINKMWYNYIKDILRKVKK